MYNQQMHFNCMMYFHSQYSYQYVSANLTFIDPCIANTFEEYNQQEATFNNLFISVGRPEINK